jgi:hypothetical protein
MSGIGKIGTKCTNCGGTVELLAGRPASLACHGCSGLGVIFTHPVIMTPVISTGEAIVAQAKKVGAGSPVHARHDLDRHSSSLWILQEDVDFRPGGQVATPIQIEEVDEPTSESTAIGDEGNKVPVSKPIAGKKLAKTRKKIGS